MLEGLAGPGDLAAMELKPDAVEPRSESTTKARWAALGAEALLIVFSVLLALALDEMRQDGRVRGTIHNEFARNRAIVGRPLP